MELESNRKGEIAPIKLASKLKRIRIGYGLTQGKMLKIINPSESSEINRARISQYELGTRIPSLIGIHNYARFAKVPVESLLDDNLDLPNIKGRGTTARKKSKRKYIKEYKPVFESNEDNSEINKTEPNNFENFINHQSKEEILSKSGFSDESIVEDENKNSEDSPLNNHAQTEDEKETEPHLRSAVLKTTIEITLSVDDIHRCKQTFLELIGLLPFNKMQSFTPDKLIEELIKSALIDYRENGSKSAFGQRIKSFLKTMLDD